MVDMTAIDPATGATRTTCPYCGVGCGVLATPDNNGGAAISGDPAHPANLGRLCSKGSALGETLGLADRLLYPMIRCSKGTMERVAWTDALDHVAHRFRHIVARDGPGAVAFYLSGQLLTEDYYLANKQKRGARIVVIDPRRTDTAGDADLFLGLKPGSDTALFSGLLVHLADHGALDHGYIARHTAGLEEALLCARGIAPSVMATALATGLAEADVAAFFQMFRETARVVTLYSQ